MSLTCVHLETGVKPVQFHDNTAEKELEEQQEWIRVQKNVYKEYLHQKTGKSKGGNNKDKIKNSLWVSAAFPS